MSIPKRLGCVSMMVAGPFCPGLGRFPLVVIFPALFCLLLMLPVVYTFTVAFDKEI